MERMILWDADGVLFQTFTTDGHFRWSQTVEADIGLTEPLLHRLFTEEWDDVLRGKTEAHARVQSFFTTHQISIKAEDFIAYWLEKDSLVNEEIAKHLTLFPSCIASNQSKMRARHFPQWLGNRIQRVFASCDIGALKPEPAFYAHIEDTLELEPRQLCLIDDTAINVKAAQERG